MDNTKGFIEALVFEGILEKKASWYKYNGSNIANGAKALRLLFDDEPSLREELGSALSEIRK